MRSWGCEWWCGFPRPTHVVTESSVGLAGVHWSWVGDRDSGLPGTRALETRVRGWWWVRTVPGGHIESSLSQWCPPWRWVPLIEPEHLKTFRAIDLRVPRTVPQVDSLFPPSRCLPPPCILLVDGITSVGLIRLDSSHGSVFHPVTSASVFVKHIRFGKSLLNLLQ